jgi:uncharacterized protein
MVQQSTTDNRYLEAGKSRESVARDDLSSDGHYESASTTMVSADGKTKIKPVRPRAGAKEMGKRIVTGSGQKRGSVLIVGFPGSGLVGSISTSYIIEKMNMHQIAFVDSEYVIPSAIYVGGKLRHPFRIYADDERTLCALVCEAPLRPEGVHSIMDLMVSWASKNHVREVFVLDGVPIRELPSRRRKPVILSSSSHVSTDVPVRNALMMGLSGGLISACLSDEMPCTGVLIPSTRGIPDPEGAAILLETISEMPNVPLEIDVQPLREQGQAIKHQLKQFIDSARKQEKEEGARHLGGSEIYG